MFENDPQFQKLKTDFEKASIAYKNAIEHRRRVRQMFKENRTKTKPVRRPVGSPKDFRIPEEQPGSKASPQKPKEFKIYMGPILGWNKLRAAPSISTSNSSEEPLQVDKIFDQISLKLFWLAKDYYLKCKKNFDQYVKKVFERKRLPATAAVKHLVNSQLLGIDSEVDIERLKNAVEKTCKEALAYLRSFSNPKPRDAIFLFLLNVADAQFVGLESNTMNQMNNEIQNLYNSGQLQKE